MQKSSHKENYLTSESLRSSLKHLIPEFTSSFTPLDDFKNLRQSLEVYKLKVDKQSSEIEFKLDEMKRQLYEKLSGTIGKESNLKFENLSEAITIEVDEKIKSLQQKSEKSEFEVLLKEEINIATKKIGKEVQSLRQVVSVMEKKLNELQNVSNLVDTKHETGSRFNSNENFESSEKHQEKTKDIIVEDEENYKTFKVSPVKVNS